MYGLVKNYLNARIGWYELFVFDFKRFRGPELDASHLTYFVYIDAFTRFIND
jgi:hypothetical protein